MNGPYIAVDQDGFEWIFESKPVRIGNGWIRDNCDDEAMYLPKGTIEKIIGKKLTWDDGPVELKEK